jgi:hypothetical protein
LLQAPLRNGRQAAQAQLRVPQHQIHAGLVAVCQGVGGFGAQAGVLLQQAFDRTTLLANAAKPAAAAAVGLQLPLEQMAEQHAETAHQFSIFLASQGCQFLLQSAPIESAAVVIPQGSALLLHPAVEIMLVPGRCHGADSCCSPLDAMGCNQGSGQ